jgi:hypothetical protein
LLTIIQILTHVENLKKNTDETVTKLSVTGYSLGGLVARYVLGVLYQRKFFDTIQPVNFNTFATPHIGLPRYDSFLNKMFRTLGPKLLSRTGGQFYTVDKWSPKGRPLIEVMADPGETPPYSLRIIILNSCVRADILQSSMPVPKYHHLC